MESDEMINIEEITFKKYLKFKKLGLANMEKSNKNNKEKRNYMDWEEEYQTFDWEERETYD